MGFWRTWIGRLDGWTTWGDSGLADEATAYLEGRLLERQRAAGAGGRVPAWLWLNAVAHGDAGRLHELADPPTSAGGWRGVRASLAREVLSRTGDDPAAIAALQRGVLVPLENRLEDVHGLSAARLHEIVLQEMWLSES